MHGVESGPHPDEVTRFGFTGMHSAGTKTVGGTNYPRLTTGSKNSGALYGVTRRDKSGVGGFSVGRFRHPPTVVFVCLAAILEGSLSKKEETKYAKFTCREIYTQKEKNKKKKEALHNTRVSLVGASCLISRSLFFPCSTNTPREYAEMRSPEVG